MQNKWFSEAKGQLHAGQMQSAYQLALGRLADDRDDADAWGMMALLALEGGNHGKALELSERALKNGCRSALVLGGRGRALLATARQDEARELATKITLEQCEGALEADTIGVILARTGSHDQALAFFELATRQAPSNAQFQYNLATSRQFVGDLDGAKSAYRKLLEIDPAYHRARLALVQLETIDEHDPAQLEQLFAHYGGHTDAALQLGHAVAKVYEVRGDHLQALEWLAKAKARKHDDVKYDRIWGDQLFAAAQKRAAQFVQISVPAQQDADCAPLFIVGMPRSGTTLVERILSSHSAVATAGELPDFALLVKRSGATPGRHTLAPEVITAPYDPAKVGGAYRLRTASLTRGSAQLIDKMPFNFFFAAHILESLPDARVLMVRRDPRDTVFANFRQLFATDFGYYDYAYDLDDTAYFVAQFNILADQFARVLPPARYGEVHYEHLIAQQEAESRRLIAFAGLEWEEQCLQFHRNAAPVSTASSVQVRSPIHSRSVGQWQRYAVQGEFIEQRLREYGANLP